MTGATGWTWYGPRSMPSDVAAVQVSRPTGAASSANATTREADARTRRFEAMFDAHHDSVWRTLRRLGVASAQVDDATQRVFIVAAQKLDDVRAGEEGAFLYGVALRTASSMRRRDPARREVRSDALLEMLADDAPGPEEELIRDQALEVLDEVLAGIPDDLREVLVLVELEGVAVTAMAELLGVPLGTASSRLRRAREAFTDSARRVRSRLAAGGSR